MTTQSFPAMWKLLAMEDCMSAIIDYRGKSPEKTKHGIPLITAKIVKRGRIEKADEFIAVEDYDEWMRRGIPTEGDVVMTTEAPLGEIAQLDGRKVALAQRLITLRGKPNLVENRYLKFVMQSEFVQNQLKARATGTTVLGIRQSELRKVLLPIPSIGEQRLIGTCLSTLDDKIDLNRRMNETLEAIAHTIFKSWFSDIDSLADTYRESCTLGRFGDVAENPRDQVIPEEIAPDIPYIGLEHMPRKSMALGEWGRSGDVTSNKFSFEAGDILFGKLRPYFHKVGVAAVKGVCSTDILVIRAKAPEWFGFVLGHSYSVEMVDFATSGSTGTKMPRTSWNELSRFNITIPSYELLRAFNEIMLPLVQRIQSNIHESRTLAQIRDTLLPKLISGEIRIKQAEKLIEAHV